MKIIMNELAYKVGPLLYMPADQANIVKKIEEKSIKNLTSIALCLEDSIADSYLKEAEKQLVDILEKLSKINSLPYIFVRIRNPIHLKEMVERLKPFNQIITGYILPKFDTTNCEEYIKIIKNLPESLYVMPILESNEIASVLTRRKALGIIKEHLDSVRDRILNVRVGCNDLCNFFGLRRRYNQTIYDINLVRDVLVDILNVFSSDYVVSGPVFEYYNNGHNHGWDDAFKREIQLDVSNGFIGKTCIHPSQLSYVIDGLKVDQLTYEDAKRVLIWEDENKGVAKGENNDHMNEVKCHCYWAQKVVLLANIYGIKDE